MRAATSRVLLLCVATASGWQSAILAARRVHGRTSTAVLAGNYGSRYSREEGDNAPVNEDAVQKILMARDEARSARDWNRADALREDLYNKHSVTVQDKEMTWTVGEGRRGSHGRVMGGGYDRGGHEQGRSSYPRGGGRGGRQDGYDGDGEGYGRGRYGNEPGGYGWRGSDGGAAPRYGRQSGGRDRYGGDSGGERGRYRDGAPGGYRDRERGGQYPGGGRGDPYGGRGDSSGARARDAEDPRERRRERDARRMQTRNAPYARAPECEAELSADDIATIDDLVNARLRKKLERQFDEADAMLVELEDVYGVTVSDDARVWRADGLSFVYAYRRDGPDGGRTAAEIAEIEELMQKRGVAKSRRQFDESDRMLDEIYDLGVDLDDKARCWWFVYSKRGSSGGGGGGGYGRDGGAGGRGATGRAPTQRVRADRGQAHDYSRSRSDDYDLGDSQMSQIDELLGRRLAAKRARDFERADRLQTELRDLGVEVDDKAREWYIRYHDGERSASSYNVRGR